MLYNFFRRIFIFILLVLYRSKSHGTFVKLLTQNCKRRRKVVNVPGITEDLDEVSTPPANCTIDTSFTCFNKDGFLLTARTHSITDKHRVSLVTLDIPGVGRYQSFNNNSSHLGQSELKLEMAEPMRVWNIKYRGMMTDCSSRDTSDMTSDQTSEPLYITAVLYWRSNTDPFDHWSSIPSWTLSKTFDDTSFTRVLEQITSGNLVFYEQWGDVNGSIKVDGQPDMEVSGWKCSRSRLFEEPASPLFETLVSQHVYIDGEGTKVMSGAMLDRSKIQRKLGFLTFPIGERWATDTSDVTVNQRTPDKIDLNNQYTVNACSMPFRLYKGNEKAGIKVNAFNEESMTTFGQFTVNGKNAYGVTYIRIGQIRAKMQQFPSVKYRSVPPREHVIDLTTCSYRASDVGGKASKLSELHQGGFVIPGALCIPINAFNAHVNANEPLRRAIERIKACISEGRVTELSHACETARHACMQTSLDASLLTLLETKLSNKFSGCENTLSFAVRSSGASEDGQNASFAGQLETFLGVKGLQDISEAIKMCWASSLSYRVVEYRRQHGHLVVEGMGVVIQEMIDADVSGVLFTNDPLTGNPSKMVINASYGLGETVVSGEVTPDTVVVKRKNTDQTFTIQETVVGSKGAILQLNKTGELERKDADTQNAREKLCMDETEIMNLCRIGIDIEKHFGQEQDIEWAMVKSKVFILQARPITSIDTETDEDMYHEFDTPCLGDNDCLTLGNVGEVLPGAASSLSLNVICRTGEVGFKYAADIVTSTEHPRFANQTISIINNRIFINLTSFALRTITLPGANKSALEIFLVGQPIPEHKQTTILNLQGRRPSFIARMVGTFRHYFIEMQRQPKRFYAWASEVDKFSIGKECHTIASLYDAIDGNLHYLIDVSMTYNYMMGQSSTWSSFVMMLLKGDKETLGQEENSDMSILLSECDNVESADVPTALNNLARAIGASEIKSEFLNSPDVQCHDLLCNTSDRLLKTQYEEFLRRHGHRCIRELELSSKSWDMDQTLLMHQLKLIIKTNHVTSTKSAMSIEDAVDSLQSPLSGFKKYLLKKFLVRKAREGVAARERGKSVTVKSFDAYKKAYRRLACMMIREGLLPDEELIFHFTHRELGLFIEQPSTAMLMRAKRRMRIRPILETLRFPLLNFTRPIPITEVNAFASVKSMKGLPVGRGVATGRACVIVTVEEADTIEKGDILICPYTDVGWTPYFPLISGIVTELGGMISHGAVVAREFGLPCVANVQGATSVFRTGDKVRIDGLAGTLELLE